MTSLLQTLTQGTLAFSAAVLLLALLRPLLLSRLGARATYLAWLAVPVMLAAPLLAMLPLPESLQAAASLAATGARVLALPSTEGQVLPVEPAAALTAHTTPALLLIWAAGAVGLALWLMRQQRRVVAGLHSDADGRWRAPAGTSPAVVGLWPQRLVLPQDFEQRFDAAGQSLVLAHEAVHARRHDNAWNLLGAALLCLQWFNPLAWWAWARMRADQELACDAALLVTDTSAAVLAAYAQAMLAAHQTGTRPVLASAWVGQHPLLERVRLLSHHRQDSVSRRLTAWLLVLGLGAAATLVARAAQPAHGPGDTEAPTTSTGRRLLVSIASASGHDEWTQRTVMLPEQRQVLPGNPWGMTLTAMQPGWCLALRQQGFADGSSRLLGQAMDETCEHALSAEQALQPGAPAVQFTAATAQGPLQARLSARWVDAQDPALAELMRQQRDGLMQLSTAQQQKLAQQQAHMADARRESEALDRAWRQAREAQRANQ